MINWFKVIKDFYNSEFYDAEQVKVFVKKGKITEKEYTEITNKVYTK